MIQRAFHYTLTKDIEKIKGPKGPKKLLTKARSKIKLRREGEKIQNSGGIIQEGGGVSPCTILCPTNSSVSNEKGCRIKKCCAQISCNPRKKKGGNTPAKYKGKRREKRSNRGGPGYTGRKT